MGKSITALSVILAISLLTAFASGPAGGAERVTFSSGQPLHLYQGRIVVPILTEAFRRLGFDFKAIAYPSLRSLDLANSGETDGELGRVRNFHKITNGQYPNLVRVDFPVMTVVIGAYAADGKTINGWSDLIGQRIAHKRGRKALESRLAEYAGGATVITTGDDETALRLVAKRRVAYAAMNEAAAEALIRTRPELSGLSRAGVLYEIGVYAYIHKRHGELGNRLAQTLETMESDGSLDRIAAEAIEGYYRSLK